MENGRVSGVVTAAGAVYDCKAAVLCMGTYMKARCLTGEHITESICKPYACHEAFRKAQRNGH